MPPLGRQQAATARRGGPPGRLGLPLTAAGSLTAPLPSAVPHGRFKGVKKDLNEAPRSRFPPASPQRQDPAARGPFKGGRRRPVDVAGRPPLRWQVGQLRGGGGGAGRSPLLPSPPFSSGRDRRGDPDGGGRSVPQRHPRRMAGRGAGCGLQPPAIAQPPAGGHLYPMEGEGPEEEGEGPELRPRGREKVRRSASRDRLDDIVLLARDIREGDTLNAIALQYCCSVSPRRRRPLCLKTTSAGNQPLVSLVSLPGPECTLYRKSRGHAWALIPLREGGGEKSCICEFG